MLHKCTGCFARKRNFTIIELIVVMLIMTLMLTIALPSFTHLNKDYKLTQAVQTIGGQIAIAKSYAMANHCYMAVIFPQKKELDSLPGSGSGKDGALASYYNVSCRIALVVKDGNDFRFVMWMPDSNWQILPENTIIGPDSGDFGTMARKLKDARLGDLTKLYEKNPSAESIKKAVDIERYVVVTPDGQLVIDGNTTTNTDGESVLKIRVTDGAYNRQQKKIVLFERSKGNQIYQLAEIDPLTCRIEYTE